MHEIYLEIPLPLLGNNIAVAYGEFLKEMYGIPYKFYINYMKIHCWIMELYGTYMDEIVDGNKIHV